jgi:hypothetical protein
VLSPEVIHDATKSVKNPHILPAPHWQAAVAIASQSPQHWQQAP